MLYFSEIVGKKVITEDGIQIGKLDDLIFLSSDQPLITKLYIHTNQEGHKGELIPIEYLKKIGSEIVVQKHYEVSDLAENELYVNKNLVDQQIIDITGNKVVRVNDIAIQESPSYYIAGVDVGWLSILRWLKLDKIAENILHLFNNKVHSHFLSWADIQPLELVRGRIILKTDQEKLEKLRPEDLADHLEKTNIKNVNKIISLLDKEFAAKVVGDLNISYQQGLFKDFTPEQAAELICLIDDDEAVDILHNLSDKKRATIMNLLPSEKRRDISYLLRHSGTPIGKLMLPDFLTVNAEMKVSEVIKKIKKETGDFYFLNIIYVVNDSEELIGVFNLHELLMQDPDTPIYKFMIRNAIVVHMHTPTEIAFKKMTRYRIRYLPVINEDKNILGIVTLDDVARELFVKTTN